MLEVEWARPHVAGGVNGPSGDPAGSSSAFRPTVIALRKQLTVERVGVARSLPMSCAVLFVSTLLLVAYEGISIPVIGWPSSPRLRPTCCADR
ncbi:hypothetical protein ABZX98_15465 [Streptomyces sp. NPDC002992]|uniref:hypothetical protein n=1 Tax=Streptomyces sp. NPDC002992 TaxID=3154273 RepID=UPI0033A01FA7